MVFQKPYLNIACKRSAQRAIPWWEHTKLSTKLIRVILRQPKESKKEKKKRINPCPAQFCKSRCLWYGQAPVCSPGTQGEGSWGKPHMAPMWKVGGGHSVAVLKNTARRGRGDQQKPILGFFCRCQQQPSEIKPPFWKRKVHVNNTLGTDQDSGKKTNASQGRMEKKFPFRSCYLWNPSLGLPVYREEDFLMKHSLKS